MSEIGKLLASLDPTKLFPGEPIKGKTLKADGWVYRDIPGKLSPEMWDFLLSIIGDGHYELLAFSEGTNSVGEPWRRGQMMVSPTGMERLTKYAEENRKP